MGIAAAGVYELPVDRDRAIAALFSAHYARLVGLARLLLDDTATAEDVVQDAFTTLFRRWPFLRDKSAALAYLQTCVANSSRRHLRRQRSVGVPDEDAGDAERSAEQHAVANDETARVIAAVSTLPARQRQVVVLRYYLDQTEAQIAASLGISKGSVKQHASRALDALAQRLEGR